MQVSSFKSEHSMDSSDENGLCHKEINENCTRLYVSCNKTGDKRLKACLNQLLGRFQYEKVLLNFYQILEN